MRDMADQLETRSKELADKVRDYADLVEKVRRERDRLQNAETLLSAKQEEIQRLAAQTTAPTQTAEQGELL